MIQDFFEDLVTVEKTVISDGIGSFIEEYQEGLAFKGAIATQTRKEYIIAGKPDIVVEYKVYVDKEVEVNLEHDSLIKRVRDEQIFRITNRAIDKVSPVMSNIQVKIFNCELWRVE